MAARDMIVTDAGKALVDTLPALVEAYRTDPETAVKLAAVQVLEIEAQAAQRARRQAAQR